MLTLSQLRTQLTDALSMDLDNVRGESPSTGDLNAQINQAYRIIARKCCLTKDTALTLVSGTALYDLRDVATPVVADKITRPELVYIVGAEGPRPLFAANRMRRGLWHYKEFVRLYPGWKSDAAGIPARAVIYSSSELLLHPAPDATTAAKSGHSVFGRYLPADLSADGDIPALPEEIHEAIGWLAAQIAAIPTATEDEAWKRIQQYSDYWTGIIQDIEQQNTRTNASWGSTSSYTDADFMRM